MHTEALTEDGLALFPALAAFDAFYLAGGTALALQIGHRRSVDFDLFSPDPLPLTLLGEAKLAFAPLPAAPFVNNPDQLTLLAGTVKVTFLTYPFPLVKPLVSLGGLLALSVTEIGATKAYTIGRRGSYKDYVDLYFILRERHTSLRRLIALAEKKFQNEFNSRLFAEQLLFLDDLEGRELQFLKKPVTPEEIVAFFREQVSRLRLA
jgi:hypothetical protein